MGAGNNLDLDLQLAQAEYELAQAQAAAKTKTTPTREPGMFDYAAQLPGALGHFGKGVVDYGKNAAQGAETIMTDPMMELGPQMLPAVLAKNAISGAANMGAKDILPTIATAASVGTGFGATPTAGMLSYPVYQRLARAGNDALGLTNTTPGQQLEAIGGDIAAGPLTLGASKLAGKIADIPRGINPKAINQWVAAQSPEAAALALGTPGADIPAETGQLTPVRQYHDTLLNLAPWEGVETKGVSNLGQKPLEAVANNLDAIKEGALEAKKALAQRADQIASTSSFGANPKTLPGIDVKDLPLQSVGEALGRENFPLTTNGTIYAPITAQDGVRLLRVIDDELAGMKNFSPAQNVRAQTDPSVFSKVKYDIGQLTGARELLSNRLDNYITDLTGDDSLQHLNDIIGTGNTYGPMIGGRINDILAAQGAQNSTAGMAPPGTGAPNLSAWRSAKNFLDRGQQARTLNQALLGGPQSVEALQRISSLKGSLPPFSASQASGPMAAAGSVGGISAASQPQQVPPAGSVEALQAAEQSIASQFPTYNPQTGRVEGVQDRQGWNHAVEANPDLDVVTKAQQTATALIGQIPPQMRQAAENHAFDANNVMGAMQNAASAPPMMSMESTQAPMSMPSNDGSVTNGLMSKMQQIQQVDAVHSGL